jgi:hypothetical protein
MSDDRNRLQGQDEPGAETEDVEAHGMQPPGGLQPPGRNDDEGDDVEAHGMQPPGRLQ